MYVGTDCKCCTNKLIQHDVPTSCTNALVQHSIVNMHPKGGEFLLRKHFLFPLFLIKNKKNSLVMSESLFMFYLFYFFLLFLFRTFSRSWFDLFMKKKKTEGKDLIIFLNERRKYLALNRVGITRPLRGNCIGSFF